MAEELSSTDKQVVIEELKRWLFEERQENLDLLITGKTGVGKSRLANALVGKNVAKEGEQLDPCTSEVTSYQAVIEGVTVAVWDSPGLQDGTGHEDQYIQDMKDNIKDIALMIYCVRMDEARFYEADQKAIKTLTDEFGKEVWNHAVVALTFANKVQDPDEEDKLRYFQSKLREWEKQLKEQFAAVGINLKTCSSIPVIPVGNNKKSMCLPDRENWLSHMWIECFQAMKVSARRPMYRINRHRVRSKTLSLTLASAPTTATYEDDIPAEIPLDEEQEGHFSNLIFEPFLKFAHKAADGIFPAAVGAIVGGALGGAGGAAIGAFTGFFSKKLMEN